MHADAAETGWSLNGSPERLDRVYDAALLDLDGVVYVGRSAVSGAADALTAARTSGMSLAFVTNNAARTPDAVAEHLTSIGISARAQDVVTSAQAAARVLAATLDPGDRVLVIGGPGLRTAIAERDLRIVDAQRDRPAAVAQGFHPSVGWKELAEATYSVRDGAIWVATNLDLTVPTDRGLAPGNGSLVGVVAAAVGRPPDVVAGKPHRPLFDESVSRVEATRPIVVGDRLDTDIEGARLTGTDSLLVLTGVTGFTELCEAPPGQRPTYVSSTLAGLSHHHPSIEHHRGAWHCRDWTATARSGELTIEPTRDDALHLPDDAVRAAAAAAWHHLDTFGEPLNLTSAGRAIARVLKTQRSGTAPAS